MKLFTSSERPPDKGERRRPWSTPELPYLEALQNEEESSNMDAVPQPARKERIDSKGCQILPRYETPGQVIDLSLVAPWENERYTPGSGLRDPIIPSPSPSLSPVSSPFS